MRILVINGPNLNLLGIREPSVYGQENYADLCAKIKAYAEKKDVDISFFQSNHEGGLVDAFKRHTAAMTASSSIPAPILTLALPCSTR